MEPLHEGEVFIFAVAEVAKRNAQGLAAWRACGERHLGIEPGTEDPESTRTGDRALSDWRGAAGQKGRDDDEDEAAAHRNSSCAGQEYARLKCPSTAVAVVHSGLPKRLRAAALAVDSRPRWDDLQSDVELGPRRCSRPWDPRTRVAPGKRDQPAFRSDKNSTGVEWQQVGRWR